MSVSTLPVDLSSRPRPHHSASLSAQPLTTLAKPPTDIHPTAHLDPSAYVLGTHPISLGSTVLIHPRVRLVSTHGPLIIDSGTIISERCIIGGPANDPRDPSSSSQISDPEDQDPLKTVLGANVMIHPAAEVMAGVTINDACIIEAHAVVLKGVSVGAHSKICAGVTVDRDVGDWEVVWGDGQTRRKRVMAEDFEDGRLKALAKEREGTMTTLKVAAAKALVAKRRG